MIKYSSTAIAASTFRLTKHISNIYIYHFHCSLATKCSRYRTPIQVSGFSIHCRYCTYQWLGWQCPLRLLLVRTYLNFKPQKQLKPPRAYILELYLSVHDLRAVSVVWTTPLVTTLGMSLTIPLAMVADMFLHHRRYSAIYILGCIQVLSCLFFGCLAIYTVLL